MNVAEKDLSSLTARLVEPCGPQSESGSLRRSRAGNGCRRSPRRCSSGRSCRWLSAGRNAFPVDSSRMLLGFQDLGPSPASSQQERCLDRGELKEVEVFAYADMAGHALDVAVAAAMSISNPTAKFITARPCHCLPMACPMSEGRSHVLELPLPFFGI